MNAVTERVHGPRAPMTSIKRTLLVWLLAGLTLIALATSAATYVAARREIGVLLDLQLKQLAYSTRIDDLLRGQRPGFNNPDLPLGAGVTDLVTQIWDRDGVLVYWTQPGTVLPVPVHDGYSTVTRSGREWRVYTMVHGGHALQIAQPQDERDALATQTALRTLIPFAALMPIFGVLIWLGVGNGLRPLESMSRAVGRRRPDAMAPIDEAGLPAELRPLGESLNGLLARLSDALSAQRRFTADAAHELRTPLAAVTLQLDLARRAGSPGELAASLSDLEVGVARASHVVEQLMTLASVEPEALAAQKSRCDLVAIVKDVIVARAALAERKGLDLGLAHAEPASIDGNPASLTILLSNLVDNALRYTPGGGRIDVAVGAVDGAALLSVSDTGPGIPPTERERVFDRFYRGANADEPGSGLGLSIVKRIADAHGATIALDAPTAGTGLIVTVRFAR